jgi:5,10-methylene-tetrahydrofolate dehydrogenase/methenyl tetrahydrofolate cyclohydrolase
MCREYFSKYDHQPSILTCRTTYLGNATAAAIRQELKEAVLEMQNTLGVTPGLAVILVGERRDSATYVRSKKKVFMSLG